jgi:hypothetical protein
MVAHPGALKAYPGAMETLSEAVDAHFGTMKTHLGAVEDHTEVWRLTLEITEMIAPIAKTKYNTIILK